MPPLGFRLGGPWLTSWSMIAWSGVGAPPAGGGGLVLGPGPGAGAGRFVGPGSIGVATALGSAGRVSGIEGAVRLKLSCGPKMSAGCCDCGVGDGGGDGEPPRGERANGSVGAGLGSAGRDVEAWTGVFWGVFWGVSPWTASSGMEMDVRVGARACAIASMSDISGNSFVSPTSVSPVGGVLVSVLGDVFVYRGLTYAFPPGFPCFGSCSWAVC